MPRFHITFAQDGDFVTKASDVLHDAVIRSSGHQVSKIHSCFTGRVKSLEKCQSSNQKQSVMFLMSDGVRTSTFYFSWAWPVH